MLTAFLGLFLCRSLFHIYIYSTALNTAVSISFGFVEALVLLLFQMLSMDCFGFPNPYRYILQQLLS